VGGALAVVAEVVAVGGRSRDPTATCASLRIARNCRKKGSRFCIVHTRSYENMKYNVGTQPDGESKKRKFVDKMSDNNVAVKEILEWEEENVDIPANKRKKPVNWARFERRYLTSTVSGDFTDAKPFEKEQFIIKMCEKFGRTRPEATSQWEEWERRQVKTDRFGYQGQLRLWIPISQFMRTGQERRIDNVHVEGGSEVKNPKEVDSAGLRRAALRGASSSGHDFFKGNLGNEDTGARSSTGPQLSPAKGQSSASGSAIDLEEGERANQRKPLTSLRMGIFNSAATALEQRVNQMNTALTNASKVVTHAIAAPPDPSRRTDVMARDVYMRQVIACFKLADCWLGAAKATPAPATQATAVKIEATTSPVDNTAGLAAPVEAAVPAEGDGKAAAEAAAPAEEKPQPEGAAGASAETAAPAGAQADSAVATAGGGAAAAGEAPVDGAAVAGGPATLPEAQPEAAELEMLLKQPTSVELGLVAAAQLAPHLRLYKLIESILLCNTVEACKEKEEEWKAALRAVSELEATFKKAIAELRRHVQVLTQAKVKAEVKAQREADVEAVKRQAKELKDKAIEIQSQKKVEVLPIFTLEKSLFKEFKAVTVKTLPDADVAAPFTLAATNNHVQTWLADKVVQRCFSQFCGSYKKHDVFQKEGKVSPPLNPKQGKEQTELMFNRIIGQLQLKGAPVLDISSVSATWMTTCWLYGYAEDFTSTGLNPNSSSVFKVLWLGEVEYITCDIKAVVEAMKKMGMEVTWEAAKAHLDKLNKESMAALVEKGAHFYFHSASKHSVTFIPTGYYVWERSKAGPVVVGARKSVFFDSTAAAASFGAAHDLLATSNRDVTKMTNILGMFMGGGKAR